MTQTERDVGIRIVRGYHRAHDAAYYAKRAGWAWGFVLGAVLMAIVGMVVFVLMVNHG